MLYWPRVIGQPGTNLLDRFIVVYKLPSFGLTEDSRSDLGFNLFIPLGFNLSFKIIEINPPWLMGAGIPCCCSLLTFNVKLHYVGYNYPMKISWISSRLYI